MHPISVHTPAGYSINGLIYQGSNSNKVLIVSGAMGTRQLYYAKFSEFMASRGFTVITFDYYGIGRSLTKPITQTRVTLEQWGRNDLESIVQYAIDTFKSSQIQILGHSAGGQLIGLAPSATMARKIVLIAAQSGYWKFWKGPFRHALWGIWHWVFPLSLAVFRYFPAKKISSMENLPAGVADQWRKWCVSPGYLFDELSQEALHFDRVKCPMHVYSCSDDHYAPEEAVNWLTDAFRHAEVERIHIQPTDLGRKKIGHFGFFRPAAKNDIWEGIYRFLSA